MTSIILTSNKQNHSSKITYDLNDLESFGNYKHGSEFIEIPSKKIGGKTLLEWFLLDDFSSWWLVAPIIHPKFKEATRFIDRILSLIEKNNVTSIRLESFFDKKNLIEQICSMKKIDFSFSKTNYIIYSQKQKLKHSLNKKRYKKITDTKFKKRLDPRLYNGAIFIGLDSPVVKSHGGTDYIGFSNSLDVCCKIVSGNLIEKIKRNI